MAASPLPPLLDLAGHPLRWGILRELARGDLRVRELTALLDEPQSLVSYHLGRLRSDGLVTTRRSSFDGRDSYYRAELARWQELFSQTAAALHPALRTGAPPAPQPAPPTRASSSSAPGTADARRWPRRCCERSRPTSTAAFSAGSRPKPVHPDAIRVMGERGIDIGAAQSKHLSVFAAERFDHVVSLCDRVREVCPEFPGNPATVHWSVPDPAGEPDGPAAFARVADELTERIGFFLHVLALRPTTPESN